jgi:hypothetical protein
MYQVLVSDTYQKDSIPVPIDRHSKRASFAACICADGSAMKGMIIVDRVTMEADLELYGYDARRLAIVSQENGFMTTNLFMKWASEIFFPTVEAKRVATGYEGPVVLILDGLGSHHNEIFIHECELQHIFVIFLAPHTSDQC